MSERLETIISINVPQMDVGAPEPAVLYDRGSLSFLYLVQEKPLRPEQRADVEFQFPEERFALVRARRCREYSLGAPSDETVQSHPFYPIGLRSYGAYEVLQSAWIAQLERSNRIHPRHTRGLFDGVRHFIFTFHDETLEIACETLDVEIFAGSRDAALRCLMGLDA